MVCVNDWDDICEHPLQNQQGYLASIAELVVLYGEYVQRPYGRRYRLAFNTVLAVEYETGFGLLSLCEIGVLDACWTGAVRLWFDKLEEELLKTYYEMLEYTYGFIDYQSPVGEWEIDAEAWEGEPAGTVEARLTEAAV